jgi:hypothetical protein
MPTIRESGQPFYRFLEVLAYQLRFERGYPGNYGRGTDLVLCQKANRIQGTANVHIQPRFRISCLSGALFCAPPDHLQLWHFRPHRRRLKG